MQVLVSNVGSTSLKFKLFSMPEDQVLCEARIERVGSDMAIYQYKNTLTGWSAKQEGLQVKSYAEGIKLFLKDMTDGSHGAAQSVSEVKGVGFKTVLAKGYNGVYELDAPVLKAMQDFLFIAPAHNTPYLSAIEEFRKIMPDVPMVGVFETAFHATIPLKNKMYAIPYEWYEKYQIARMGYHGASFSYIAQKSQEDGDFSRVIGCHLGGSCSVCAIKDGRSYDTSFGFSLQSGIPHANRCGDTDAYLIPFLMNEGLSQDEILDGLSKRGGLLGVSGVGNDLREIEAAAAEGNERARLAIDVFVVSVLRYIGSFYVELGGLDKLVFTGGIGENSVQVRARICEALAHIGVVLDTKANRELKGEGYISASGSAVKVQVIAANEELGVARQTYQCICRKKKTGG